jgi:hypothetical protein
MRSALSCTARAKGSRLALLPAPLAESRRESRRDEEAARSPAPTPLLPALPALPAEWSALSASESEENSESDELLLASNKLTGPLLPYKLAVLKIGRMGASATSARLKP